MLVDEGLLGDGERGMGAVRGGKGTVRPPPCVVAVNVTLFNELDGALAFHHTIVYSQQEERIRYELSVALSFAVSSGCTRPRRQQSLPTHANTLLPFHRRLSAAWLGIRAGSSPTCLQSAALPGDEQ